MYCTTCKWEYPYDTDYLESNCISCNGPIITSAEEWLERTELGLAKEVRPNQIQLTGQVRKTYQHGGVLIAEAGTGVGKSFAYLLPTIIGSFSEDGRQVIVTTAKKTLQQQLFYKDIPAVEKVLNHKIKSVLLYGRSNYACKRLWYQNKEELNIDDRFIDDFFGFSDQGLTEDLDVFLKKRKPKQLKVLQSRLTALNAGDCSLRTTQCAYRGECPYVLNRRKVANADVIVTNHWMLGYDLLTSLGHGDVHIFAKTDNGSVLIVDEAHKFEDAVRKALTIELKKSTLSKHLDALGIFLNPLTWPAAGLQITRLSDAWRDLFAQVQTNRNLSLSTDTPLLGAVLTAAQDVIDRLRQQTIIDTFLQKAAPASKNGVNLSALLHRLVNEQISVLTSAPIALKESTPVGISFSSLTDTEIAAVNTYINFNSFLKTVTALGTSEENSVCYIDNENGHVSIKEAPVDLNMFIRPYLNQKFKASVFLSATLAINNSFNYFAHRMGISTAIPSVVCAQYPTEFDYSKQAVLYINNKLPAPQVNNMTAYYNGLTTEIAALLNASKGNAFVLFTARDDLSYVTNNIRPLLQAVTVFSQTEVTAQQALKEYMATPQSALMGLKTFWEGIDIPGDKLRLVIITKLPFPNSKDPIIAARCKKADDRAFIDVQLPEMISDLRQGVGRLIRSKTDRGVIAILDSRLLTKSYKNAVLNSLGISRVLTDTQRVLRNLEFLASQ